MDILYYLAINYLSIICISNQSFNIITTKDWEILHSSDNFETFDNLPDIEKRIHYLVDNKSLPFRTFIKIYYKENNYMNKLQYMTISPACPCCSAYMEEHEDYWVCPVCGAVVDKG